MDTLTREQFEKWSTSHGFRDDSFVFKDKSEKGSSEEIKEEIKDEIVNWQIQDQVRSDDDYIVMRLRIPEVRNGMFRYLDKVHHRALEVIMERKALNLIEEKVAGA